MARFGVRSGSLAFARPIGNPENKRFERTDANGSERSLAFAMQKVVGSNPIIRFSLKSPQIGSFSWARRVGFPRSFSRFQPSACISKARRDSSNSCSNARARRRIASCTFAGSPCAAADATARSRISATCFSATPGTPQRWRLRPALRRRGTPDPRRLPTHPLACFREHLRAPTGPPTASARAGSPARPRTDAPRHAARRRPHSASSAAGVRRRVVLVVPPTEVVNG
jgi:hypothetical protein